MGLIMKIHYGLIVSVATTALSVGFSEVASAADLTQTPVYTKAPPVVGLWSGLHFYLGVDAGGAFANQDVTNAGSGSLGGDSVMAGGLLGFSWGLAPNWVVGIESDLNATRLTSSTTAGGALLSRDVTWLASGRARAGYLVTPNALVYATGGAAWSGSTYTASDTIQGGFTGNTTGWVVGGGLEWAFDSHMRARAEFLYYRVPGQSPDSNYLPTPGPSFGDLSVSVGRLGVAYAF
jgi:outer membrane immunogenic protein